MIRVWCLVYLIGLLTACGQDRAPSWVPGETGIVVRVTDGDTFALNTGQVVRLASVEAPSMGYRDRERAPHAEESKLFLERLVKGRTVELFYPGITRDRYDRAIAQAYVTTEGGQRIWVNAALVEAGITWVRVYPDTMLGSEALWPLEEDARKMKAGLWEESPPLYGVSDRLPEKTFVILETSNLSFQSADQVCNIQLAHSPLTGVLKNPLNSTCPTDIQGPVELRGWHKSGNIFIDEASNIRMLTPQE